MRSVRRGARICHDALRLGSDGCNTAIGPIGEGSRDRCHVSDKDFVGDTVPDATETRDRHGLDTEPTRPGNERQNIPGRDRVLKRSGVNESLRVIKPPHTSVLLLKRSKGPSTVASPAPPHACERPQAHTRTLTLDYQVQVRARRGNIAASQVFMGAH